MMGRRPNYALVAGVLTGIALAETASRRRSAA